MQDDVGVAVAGEAARMGDCDAAEHQRAAPSEAVNVEAHSGSRDHAGQEPLLGADEIAFEGELRQILVALNPDDAHHGGAGQRGVVGKGLGSL